MDMNIHNINARVEGGVSGARTPGPGFSNVSCQCSVRVIILMMMVKTTK